MATPDRSARSPSKLRATSKAFQPQAHNTPNQESPLYFPLLTTVSLPPPRLVREIVLIRHGHSEGQAAGKAARASDPRLIDCDLSQRGYTEVFSLAQSVQSSWIMTRSQDVSIGVVSSPLTRALKTALIAFDPLPVLVHPDVAERGGRIPENKGRSLSELQRDVSLNEFGFQARADVSRIESAWPEDRRVVRSEEQRRQPRRSGRINNGQHRVRERPPYLNGVFDFISALPFDKIVLVSHHNWIQEAFEGRFHGYVDNATPIHANLVVSRADGEDSLASEAGGVKSLMLSEKSHWWFGEAAGEATEQPELEAS